MHYKQRLILMLKCTILQVLALCVYLAPCNNRLSAIWVATRKRCKVRLISGAQPELRAGPNIPNTAVTIYV